MIFLITLELKFSRILLYTGGASPPISRDNHKSPSASSAGIILISSTLVIPEINGTSVLPGVNSTCC